MDNTGSYVISVAVGDVIYVLGDDNGDVLVFTHTSGETIEDFIVETSILSDNPDFNLSKIVNPLMPRKHSADVAQLRKMIPKDSLNSTMLLQSKDTEESVMSFVMCQGDVSLWRASGTPFLLTRAEDVGDFKCAGLDSVLKHKVILPEGKEIH